MDSLPANYVPELRNDPPWLMQEMVAAEPALVPKILGSTAEAGRVAELIERAIKDRSAIVITGCGTSETAAMAVTDLLADAIRGRGVKGPLVHARQAFEASLDPWPGGVCLGISHEGSTHATILAMEAARAVGATTALITARSESAGTKPADSVVVTPLIDRSWCHTVGYLSPILAGAVIAQALVQAPIDVLAFERALRGTLELSSSADAVARALFGVNRLLIVGSGADRSPARELALKIEEGVWLPARMLDTETVLHGHLAACDQHSGMVVIATDANERVITRTKLLVQAAERIGMRVVAIMSSAVDRAFDKSVPRDRLVLPNTLEPHGLIGRFAGAALGLQQLTLALSRLAGTNPDLIRRQQAPYREAAKIAESSSSW